MSKESEILKAISLLKANGYTVYKKKSPYMTMDEIDDVVKYLDRNGYRCEFKPRPTDTTFFFKSKVTTRFDVLTLFIEDMRKAKERKWVWNNERTHRVVLRVD